MRALWIVILLGCQDSKPATVDGSAAPADATYVTVRLFERLAPKTVHIRGSLRINPRTHEERDAPTLMVQIEGGNLIAAGQKQPAIVIEPLDGVLHLDPGGGYARELRGVRELELKASAEAVAPFATVSLEEYVAAVVQAEIPDAPPAAMRAQAVVSRTYALKNRGRHGIYDFCDLTHCQVFKGAANERAKTAARDTVGQTLTFKGELSEVFFSSTCGGHTASTLEVWGSESAVVGVHDADENGTVWCEHSPHFNWHTKLSRKKVLTIFRQPTIRLIFGEHGRVSEVRMDYDDGGISGELFRIIMGRKLGWSTIKSTRFTLETKGDELVFKGRGLGHGVGLCQYGAMAQASRGRTYRQILRHYFPALALEPVEGARRQ